MTVMSSKLAEFSNDQNKKIQIPVSGFFLG